MNQIYHVSKNNDKIDETLGTFLNAYPEREKLKIMFLRESEGVYLFGSKRVYIKIEKGDNILIRVGGGFMHIGEFISQYTLIEMDKRVVKSQNVLGKFQTKLVM